MENNKKGVLKKILRFFSFVVLAIFTQFLILNILPLHLNNVDIFLILSAIFVLKGDYRESLPFLFFSMYVDEIIFPIAKINGVKTLSALIFGYIFYQIFKRIVLKGWLLCFTVAVYCFVVFVFTKLFLYFLGYASMVFDMVDYVFLFLNSFLLTCFINRKLNVW